MEYLRKRQLISTIDTNSPSRSLLLTGTPPPNQTYNMPTGMTVHSGAVAQSPLGYCTLRNGSRGQHLGKVRTTPVATGPTVSVLVSEILKLNFHLVISLILFFIV